MPNKKVLMNQIISSKAQQATHSVSWTDDASLMGPCVSSEHPFLSQCWKEKITGRCIQLKKRLNMVRNKNRRKSGERGSTCTPCRPFHQLQRRSSLIRQSVVLLEEPCHQSLLLSAQHQSCHPLRSAPVCSGERVHLHTISNSQQNYDQWIQKCPHLAQKLKLFIKCVKAQIRSFFRRRQTSDNLASTIFHH